MLDISGKIDKFNLEILKKIKEIADKLNIEFFLIGATVRDLILHCVYNINVYRATNDIDFAVKVKSWNEYNLLIDEIKKQGFIKNERIKHRYSYNGMIVDFIPFGDISDNNETITWPDEDKKEMNIIGFDDAYANTEQLLLQSNPDIIINSASVECLVMLKIFAWNDRTLPTRLRDAKDLYLIITTYLDAGNLERLVEKHIDLFEGAVDSELSGARLLGRDISKIASGKVKEKILTILNGKFENLANEMAEYEETSSEKDKIIEKSKKLLYNLILGLQENNKQ